MIDPTPAGRSTTTITNVISTTDIYDTVIEYLKSMNVPYTLTDYGIKLVTDNAVVEMYINNATWTLHVIINHQNNSLSSDMYVKQKQAVWGSYLLAYEKERTKLWIKVKLTGNSVWDTFAPLLSFAVAVDLVGKQLNFLIPPSLW
jgi:hypothetical protein